MGIISTTMYASTIMLSSDTSTNDGLNENSKKLTYGGITLIAIGSVCIVGIILIGFYFYKQKLALIEGKSLNVRGNISNMHQNGQRIEMATIKEREKLVNVYSQSNANFCL